MIYLITVHDRSKMLADIKSKQQLETKFWKSILKLTQHKAILYPVEFLSLLDNKPIPNTVNIALGNSNKRETEARNMLVTKNYKDIITSFGGKNEDIYILATNKNIIEQFMKEVDFIIDYTTEETKCTNNNIFDVINFADFTLLRKAEHPDFDIRYFIREKTNFIGY